MKKKRMQRWSQVGNALIEEELKSLAARKATPSTEIRDRDDSDLFAR
jgi:hypothetical protein